MPKNALCRKEFTNQDLGLQVRTITNEDGSISINAEDTAIGFGWAEMKDGKQYVMWRRINQYCEELGFSAKVSKDEYIPESLFYLLGMKASNKTAQEFQRWLAIDVIPSIRKTGSYSMQGVDINQIIATQNLLNERFNAFSENLTEKINKLEAQAEFNHRPSHATKLNWNKVIKTYAKCQADEENIKHIVFAKFSISKWEDLTSDKFSEVFGYIREIAEKANLIKQVSLFDKKENDNG